MDEKRKYGHNSYSVPIFFTCNMSWSILKSSLRCFNNQSVEEYITSSYKIATGQASFSDLAIKPSKSLIHFSLSHTTHTFSRCLKKYLTRSKKKFLMYSSSVLANHKKKKMQKFRSIIYIIFVVLLFVQKIDCFEIHFQHLAIKIEELGKTKDCAGYLIEKLGKIKDRVSYLIEELGKTKDRVSYLIDNGSLKLESNNFKTKLLHEFDSIHEERYYQQPKISLY